MSFFNRKKKNCSEPNNGVEKPSPASEVETEKSGLLNRINPFSRKETPAAAGDNLECEDQADQRLTAEGEETPRPEAEYLGADQDATTSAAVEPKPRLNFLQRFKQGLSKTRENLAGKIQELVKNTRKLDDDFWEELEEILIQADVGMNTSVELVAKIRQSAKKQRINDANEVLALIQQEVTNLLQNAQTLP